MKNESLLAREEALLLYERYGSLLPSVQAHYFEEHYVYDLSLGEIAENEGVTRSAVNDALKKSIKKLSHYEESLHLVDIKRKALPLLNKAKEGDKRALEELEEIINGI